MKEEVDELTGFSRQIIVQSQDEKKHPQLLVLDDGGQPIRKILMPVHAILMVPDGEKVLQGRHPVEDPPRDDQDQGHHRRPPARGGPVRGPAPQGPGGHGRGRGDGALRRDRQGIEKDHRADRRRRGARVQHPASGLHVNVQEGERVRAGDAFTDGPKDPHKILEILGERELQKYLLDGIQEVYRLQGVNINDKHIETIIRQMMRWIKVEDVGDTEFIVDEQVDRFRFVEENERVLAAGGAPARGRPLLLGITKASLSARTRSSPRRASRRPRGS